MVIFKKIAGLRQYLSDKKARGRNIGFIPTMGALHAGHVSLLEKARADGMFTVCSIFLNPTQFNDKKDYEKYPVSAEADIEILLNAKCDVVFLPPVQEIYPNGFDEAKIYDFGYLDTVLEGANRPGHFRGVGQVVGRLLEIVEPQRLYLGRKDYQQCMVISRLKEMMGLKDLQIEICPTRREPDGLAMSSRNRRLTEPQRAVAGLIYQCLVSIVSKQETDDFSVVKKQCEDILSAKGFEPEYIALANANDLTLLDNYQKDKPMIALIAARIGGIRLIDNILVNEK